MPRPLNQLQRAFCEHYAKTGDATNSAISAGYSAKTAGQMGYKLLKHSSCAAEIARLTTQIEKKSALNAEKIMDALRELVDFDIAQCFDDAGNLLPIKRIPLEARKAITAIDMSKPGGSIKSSSRLGAIELAAKLLGMVREQQNAQASVQIILAQPPTLPERQDTAQITPVW